MARLSRLQLNAIIRASFVSTVLTNLQAGRMGMNVGKLTSSSPSRIYVDYTRRTFGKFLVPTTATPVALDGSGNPTASYEFILSAAPQANDLGVYNCWIPGQISGGGGGGLGIAKSSATTTTVVNFSSPVYTSGDNTTRFTMTVVSGGGTLGVVVSNPTDSGYLRILPATINGVAVTEAQSNDFHPDSITQMALGTTIRSLDWLEVNQTTESDWAGSIAAGGDGSIRAKSKSLGEFCRYAAACGANLWSNIPAQATDDYITQFVGALDAAVSITKIINLEWANEPWNPAFIAYSQLTYLACKLGGTFAGSFARFANDANVVSCTRDGAGTATAIVSGAPAFTTSGHKIFVAGITSITGGYVTTTAVVNNGDGTWSLSWAEAGGAVTGTVVNSPNNFNSYIHTNVDSGAVHYLVKPLTTYGQQLANTFVTPYTMKGRYLEERLRATWTAIQLLPGKARFRLWSNNQMGAGSGNGLSENEVYPYALERWGDHSWIYSVASAPYIANNSTSTATSTDNVFALLGTALTATVTGLLPKEGNAAASWGHPKGFYEYGPGTTLMGTAGAFIGAAHTDDRMRTDILLPLMAAMRDFGQSAPGCYYQGGSAQTFGTADNSCWAIAQGGAVADFTQPKSRAMVEWGAASSVAAPRDGYTSGTINTPTVWSMSTGSGNANGCIVVGPTVVMGDCAHMVVKTIAGNYAIDVYDCGTSASDWVTILINGVEVAHQTPLIVQNPTIAAPSTPVWSSAGYPFNAGINIVTRRYRPTTRTGTMGLFQIVSPDTPV